ncbi:MAG: hypothetical protein AAGA80_06515 [Cyanobacteria bacterium P01_F01_bin.143]
MNSKTYSFEEIKNLLPPPPVKDKRTICKIIDAAGYQTKESYSEEELLWIKEVHIIRQEQNATYADIKVEIEKRKQELHRQKLLGGSAQAESNSESNNSASYGSVPPQPSIDSSLVGDIVENLLQEQINAHVVRCMLNLPTMMNNSYKHVEAEIKAAQDIALEQQRKSLRPMKQISQQQQKQIEAVEVDNQENEQSIDS